MNRGIYATATGMSAMQKWMDVVTNNLANAGTTGFKRDTVAFNDLLVRQMRADGGAGAPLGGLGSGSIPMRQGTVFERGPLATTNNPLDLAIDSDQGLFAIEQPGSGRRYYTRDGSFRLDEDYRLVTKTGDFVLDDSGSPITLGPGKIAIAEDGTITLDDQPSGRIGVWDGTFVKSGHNLFTSTDAQSTDASLKAGALEGSNVNAVEAMIEMIKLGRIFELSQKSIQQQDELTGRLIQSLQDR
ncbi:MAG TPA: flagellar hook-basal body protein [Fimbriimonadaceae bacterium]|nr:flagellar hook-basal body protein [Fimbriimonadaceae bacterium]